MMGCGWYTLKDGEKIGGRKGRWGHSVFSFDEGWKKRRFGKVIGDYEQKWGMTGSFHVKMKGIWMSWEFAWVHKFLEQHQGGWEQVQWTWDPCDRRMEAQENQNLRKTVTKLLWEMEVEERRAAEDDDQLLPRPQRQLGTGVGPVLKASLPFVFIKH